MKTKRFITSILKAAQEDPPQMPWARGASRRAFVAKRAAILKARRTA